MPQLKKSQLAMGQQLHLRKTNTKPPWSSFLLVILFVLSCCWVRKDDSTEPFPNFHHKTVCVYHQCLVFRWGTGRSPHLAVAGPGEYHTCLGVNLTDVTGRAAQGRFVAFVAFVLVAKLRTCAACACAFFASPGRRHDGVVV